MLHTRYLDLIFKEEALALPSTESLDTQALTVAY